MVNQTLESRHRHGTFLDTQRVMNVARRFRYALAQKYDRFSITEL
jgi:hypothetical protein